MPLIKSKSPAAELQSAIVLHLGDLQREAQRIEDEALQRAQQTIEHARNERLRLIQDADALGHKQGYERGYAEGLAAGQADGHAQAIEQSRKNASVLSDAWHVTLDDFERIRDDILHEARTDILRLAAMVAEKITRRTVELDHTIAARQLENALELVQRTTRLTIAINPADRTTIEQILPTALQRLHHSAHAQVLDDDSLGPGSVILRTEHGVIDASIDTQIDRLVDAIIPKAQHPTQSRTASSNPADSTDSDQHDSQPIEQP